MLTKRLITSLWALPLVVVAIWFDQPLPWFAILAAFCGLIATYEFYQMVAAAKVPPLTYFGLIGTLVFILSPLFELSRPLILSLVVVLSLILLLAHRQKEQAFASWAWTMAGILYLGWLLSYLVALRGLEDGRNWVLFAFFVTFATDTSAFFIGRALGRHRLAPKISPAKTWEGAIAGVIGAVIISQLFVLATPLVLPLTWWQAILLGLVVSVFCQLGDLVESLFKRNMEAKEAGRMFPGHGGSLDRLDSIIFAGIVVYYYVIWVI